MDNVWNARGQKDRPNGPACASGIGGAAFGADAGAAHSTALSPSAGLDHLVARLSSSTMEGGDLQALSASNRENIDKKLKYVLATNTPGKPPR